MSAVEDWEMLYLTELHHKENAAPTQPITQVEQAVHELKSQPDATEVARKWLNENSEDKFISQGRPIFGKGAGEQKKEKGEEAGRYLIFFCGLPKE